MRQKRLCGLPYQKIDACVNDCMLQWKKDEEIDTFNVCDTSRWEIGKCNRKDKRGSNHKKVAQRHCGISH